MVNWYDLMEQIVSRWGRQTSLGNVGVIIAKGILGDPGSSQSRTPGGEPPRALTPKAAKRIPRFSVRCCLQGCTKSRPSRRETLKLGWVQYRLTFENNNLVARMCFKFIFLNSP